jgi:hypothetical protein
VIFAPGIDGEMAGQRFSGRLRFYPATKPSRILRPNRPIILNPADEYSCTFALISRRGNGVVLSARSILIETTV